MALTKMYTKCEKCKHKDNCDEKRMMACGYIDGNMLTQDVSMDITMPNAMPVIDTPADKRKRQFEQDLFNKITNNAFCVFKGGA